MWFYKNLLPVAICDELPDVGYECPVEQRELEPNATYFYYDGFTVC